MTDERRISLCIPTWNRLELLIDSFINVLYDERISEIVIVDDASDIEIYNQIEKFCDGIPKIKLFRNEVNLDCYRNKREAISKATNEWCILFDSDNIIKTDYIDRLYGIEKWQHKTSYMPSLAFPTFSYKNYSGHYIYPDTVASYLGKPLFDTMLNCMNFFINKDEYLKVWDGNVNPHTADSIYFNYCWFNYGNRMHVVPNLSYYHRIHDGSHYRLNNHLTSGFYETTIEKLRSLA